MRSIDEQFREITRRADNLREKRILQRRVYVSSLAVTVCILLLITVCAFLPRINDIPQSNPYGQYGSLLLPTAYVGYVLIGTVAFALGICSAILFVNIREMKQKEREGQ